MSGGSALYAGQVSHDRSAPVRHAFRWPLYMLYLDLGETPRECRPWPLLSTHPAFLWFRRADHFGDRSRPLDECARDLVRERHGFRPGGPVRLLTNPRTAGIAFNPVSNLTSQCKATNSGSETLSFAYTAFAAAPVNETTPVDLTFDCTRNFTPASVAFDVVNGTALGVGVVGGLQYTLTATAQAAVAGSAATTASIGTATVRTWRMTGQMPDGQAGDATAATSHTRTLIVTY